MGRQRRGAPLRAPLAKPVIAAIEGHACARRAGRGAVSATSAIVDEHRCVRRVFSRRWGVPMSGRHHGCACRAIVGQRPAPLDIAAEPAARSRRRKRSAIPGLPHARWRLGTTRGPRPRRLAREDRRLSGRSPMAPPDRQSAYEKFRPRPAKRAVRREDGKLSLGGAPRQEARKGGGAFLPEAKVGQRKNSRGTDGGR